MSTTEMASHRERLVALYVEGAMSIPQVSKAVGKSQSAVRHHLHRLGVLRSRADAIRLSGAQGRLGSGIRGTTRTFSEEWRKNLSASLSGSKGASAVGVSLKPSGYYEITRGENKGRSAHVVAMEKSIGRRMNKNEVVHHRDEDKTNNDLSNLELMTRSEHTRLHRLGKKGI